MRRILNGDIPKKNKTEVKISGWVREIRKFGKLNFLIIRDVSGEAQVIIKKGEVKKEILEKIENINRESVLEICGEVKTNKEAPGGIEIIPKKLKVLSEAETPLPIDFSGKIETNLDKRLDNRFIDLRNPKIAAIFKIRDKICTAIREYLEKNNFIEMQTPKIVGAGAEGGSSLFNLDYFGKKAYLSQSQQLYKQTMLIAGFDRVYEIGPSFRAEKSHTRRHISEFTQLDVELAFIEDEGDILEVQENLVSHVIKEINKNCKKELEKLDIKIETPKTPFPRVSYEEALEFLKEAGEDVKEGEDIGIKEEKKLGKIIKEKYSSDFYFITKFPWNLEVCKFYWMRDGKCGRGADLEYKGQELTSGSQREHRYKELIKQIKEKNLNVKDFEYYTYPFRFGAPPHGGFGLGIDRFVMYILDLKNIREAVLFPRDTERLTP